MLKLLIVDGTEDFRIALAEAMKEKYIIKTCDDGQTALAAAQSFEPDLLILDLMMAGVDGLSLVEKITRMKGKPLVLATTRFRSEYLAEAADRVGVDYMMVKPCNLQAMVARMEDMANSRNREGREIPNAGVLVANALMELGVATKVSGFAYLREAIPMFARNPRQAMTKELYPAVGKLIGTGTNQVERAIRTAIDGAWKDRNERVWRMYFTPGADGSIRKPTNSEFIARLAELLIVRNGDDLPNL